MKQRQQGSTSYPITFLLVSSTDHITPVTGVTPTVTLSKNGGAFGAAAGAVTEIGSGWYAIAGHATDRNTAGDLLVHATATGADPADDRYAIVPWDPFDAAALGLTRLDAAVSTRLASGSYTAPPTAAAIRTEIDSNSTKLDAAVSTRLASSSYTAAPTAAAIRTEIDANSTKLDVAVGTRLATSGYTAPATTAAIATAVWGSGTRTLTGFGTLVADIWAHATRSLTDKADFTLSYLGLVSVADMVLKRDWTEVSSEPARCVLNALRAIRNKVTRAGSTITVRKEDDATAAWTAAIVADAAAAPVTEVDPS